MITMSLSKSFNLMTNISISIIHQRLYLKTETQSREYIIATSKHGPGEEKDSFCTPRGQHLIRAKIGAGQPRGQIFKGRRPTGTVFSADINGLNGRDWILTRILWLSGTEIGKNRLGNVDSMQRYIYIHGVPDELILGIPGSKGCINMSNNDIEEVFDLVDIGTPVVIE